METEEETRIPEDDLVRKVRELLAAQERGPGSLEKVPDKVPPNKNRSWWWVELWWEKRQLFKEGVWHLLVFAALLGSLEGAHRLLKLSTISPDRVAMLDAVHFYMYAIILVIFATSFIIKVLKSEFGKSKDE